MTKSWARFLNTSRGARRAEKKNSLLSRTKMSFNRRKYRKTLSVSACVIAACVAFFFLLIYLMGAIDILNSTALRFDVIFSSLFLVNAVVPSTLKSSQQLPFDDFFLLPKTIPQDKSRENMKTILLICWPFFFWLSSKTKYWTAELFSFLFSFMLMKECLMMWENSIKLFACLSFAFRSCFLFWVFVIEFESDLNKKMRARKANKLSDATMEQREVQPSSCTTSKVIDDT